jgi:hypothetical protein
MAVKPPQLDVEADAGGVGVGSCLSWSRVRRCWAIIVEEREAEGLALRWAWRGRRGGRVLGA